MKITKFIFSLENLGRMDMPLSLILFFSLPVVYGMITDPDMHPNPTPILPRIFPNPMIQNFLFSNPDSFLKGTFSKLKK